MGSSVIERRGGSVVWVLRQNGTWWPGRILCSNEIPTSGILSGTNFSSRFPIKLLGRDDASVCWYNLEKSTRVKAFRCGEFDGCIKKAESSKNLTYTKSLKYAHREDAILHALELEKQDQEKQERPVFRSGTKEGESHGESNQRAKRSKRFYSPIDSTSFLEKSVHSQSSNMIATSIHAAENSSSKSTSSLKGDSESSHRRRETTAGHNALRPTKMSFKVISRPAVNKWKHNGEVHNQHSKSTSVVSTDERSTEFGSKTKPFENMPRDVNQKSQPSPVNSFSEDTSVQSPSSKITTRKNSTMTLIDVHMTVQSTYRGEHTPLVSLMSRLNGKAIVGHPINIEVIYDSSMLPVKNESSDQLQNKSRMPQLAWRTSKRTPVCYTSSTSSAPKYENLQHSSKKLGDLSFQARENIPFNTKSRGKSSKKPNMSKHKPRSLYSADSRIKNAVKDDRLPCVTCVPVKDIFIKLIGALGNTTLLNHILTSQHGKRIAVIENEFGEVDIDGSLVASHSSSNEDILMVNNGCLCCTVRGDLVKMLLELVKNRRDKFDHIVIETTGLAKPGPVIETFCSDELVSRHVKLDGVVTLVDCKHALQHLNKVKPRFVSNEAVEQVAYADRIILNKIDLVSESELEVLTKRIKHINGMAQIKRAKHGVVNMDFVLGVGGYDLDRVDSEVQSEGSHCGHKHEDGHEHHKDHHHDHVHDSAVSSVSIVSEGTLDLDEVDDWLDRLIEENGDDLYRMKGVLSVKDSEARYVFQGVHSILDGCPGKTWEPNEKRISKLVFIGRNLDETALRKGFKGCLCDE